FINNGGIILPGNAFYTDNLLLNPSADDGVVIPWTPDLAGYPTVVNDGYPHTGGFEFFGGGDDLLYGDLTQTINLVGNQGITAAALDSAELLANVSFWGRTFDYYQYGAPYDY